MSRVCEICGKGGNKANSIQRRGKAKKKGGVGRNITSSTKRTQRPNLKKLKQLLTDHQKELRCVLNVLNQVRSKELTN